MHQFSARTVVLLFLAGSPLLAAAQDPCPPDTVLWDSGSPAANPLSTPSFARKPGWTAVPENELAHRFQGDAVMVNDRLAVVLRAQGSGAEVYAFSAAGARLRVGLSPLRSPNPLPSRFVSLKIVENSPGAVALTANFLSADRRPATVTYRLTAGQMIVEVLPGEGVERLRVQGESRYVVVPDFFGDDMVFAADTLRRSRLRLPTENFFLSLTDHGSAQVMCVWSSGRQEVEALGTSGSRSAITGCEIQASKDQRLWVAVLEDVGRWHVQALQADGGKAVQGLAWQPPFPAKWRVDLLDVDGSTRSGYLPDGVALGHSPATMLVYALDRTRATPLTTFCPIDVLRNTLGVGPCQYILQTEKLAADESATPNSVMAWIEKQFKRKKQQSAAAEIGERLEKMVQHIQHTHSRIEQYEKLAADIRQLCQGQDAEAIDRLAVKLQQLAELPSPVARATKLATAIGELVGMPDALPACERIGSELRAIGAAQDRALANCRMTARWLKQSAAMAGEDHPRLAPWTKNVAERIEQVLQTK